MSPTAASGTPPSAAATTPPSSLSGGPTETVTAPAPKTEAPRPTKILLGDREFASVDDLKAYTSELKGKADLADQLRTVINPPAAPTNPTDTLEDLMYSDPAKYNKMMLEQAATIAENRINQKNAVKTMRDNFFDTYKDLKDHQDLVDLKYSQWQNDPEMKKKLAQMTEQDAVSTLANAVRARIAAIKGTQQATEELPNGIPNVVGQGSSLPTAPPAAKPMTFFDQLKANQKKGKK